MPTRQNWSSLPKSLPDATVSTCRTCATKTRGCWNRSTKRWPSGSKLACPSTSRTLRHLAEPLGGSRPTPFTKYKPPAKQAGKSPRINTLTSASSTSLAAMVVPDEYRSKDKFSAALQDEQDGAALPREDRAFDRGSQRRRQLVCSKLFQESRLAGSRSCCVGEGTKNARSWTWSLKSNRTAVPRWSTLACRKKKCV